MCPERRWSLMLASKGTEVAGQGRRESDRRVARPEDGRDAVSLGDVVLEITEGVAKEKIRWVEVGPAGGTELDISRSSRHRDDHGTWAPAR